MAEISKHPTTLELVATRPCTSPYSRVDQYWVCVTNFLLVGKAFLLFTPRICGLAYPERLS